MPKYILVKPDSKVSYLPISNQFEKISINPNNGQTSWELQSDEEKENLVEKS